MARGAALLGLCLLGVGCASLLSGDDPQRVVVWVDRAGLEERLPMPIRGYGVPRLSPDGRRLAVRVWEAGRAELWVYDVESGDGRLLTRAGTDPNLAPIWAPGAARIIYRVPEDDTVEGGLFWIAADGSDDGERLMTSDTADYGTSVSPDGQTLIFTRVFDPGTNAHREIWALSLDGDRSATPLLTGPLGRSNGALSPDGHWLAYRSNESGKSLVYVDRYPDLGSPSVVGEGEGSVWSADGKELYYRAGRAMMAAAIQTDPTLRIGEPAVLFEGTYFSTGGARQYHVSPDGRFLMIREARTASFGPFYW